MRIQPTVRHPARRHDGSCELRMQPHRPIADARKVARVKGGAREEIGHQPIHRAARALHQVEDERVAHSLIGVEEAARQIKTTAGERLPALAFEERVGVVEDRLPWSDSMSAIAVRCKW
jgi:hypothetical protein